MRGVKLGSGQGSSGGFLQSDLVKCYDESVEQGLHHWKYNLEGMADSLLIKSIQTVRVVWILVFCTPWTPAG